MYDPACAGDKCEWIELYNTDGEINLSLCRLGGKNLPSFVIKDDSYVVLTNNKESFKSNYSNFIENENLLEFSSLTLANPKNKGDNKNISLSGENCASLVFYNNSLGGNGNNHSIEKNKNNHWSESLIPGGTPGAQNSIWDFSSDYFGLKISEFLPDPGDAADKPLGEWIELYNSGKDQIYLGDLVLYDNNDEHELYLTSTNAENLKLCPGCYTLVYKDGDSDFSLNDNGKDELRLFTGYPPNESELIDNLSFSDAVEGMSWSNIEGQWYKTQPTPGKTNVYSEGCDWQIGLSSTQLISSKDNFSFSVQVKRNYGLPDKITVHGEIRDFFGKVIKEYSPWTGQEAETELTRTYSPNLPESLYQISFGIENLSCKDLEDSNNEAVMLGAVNPHYEQNSSYLDIEEIYLGNDLKAKWGDQFTAKIKAYKGDESRYSLQLGVEKDGVKVSKTTKFNLYDQYKEYTLTLPLQLEQNCDEKIPEGKYDLVMEAFGLRTEKELEISGVNEEVCKEYLSLQKDAEKRTSENLPRYSLLESPSTISKGDLFKIKLQILNDEKDHEYSFWSYLYRGSKCYSCSDKEKTREDNLEKIQLRPGEAQVVEMVLKADEDLEEGEYNLKVKIQKDEQKTLKELTETMIVQELSVLSDDLETLSTGSSPEVKEVSAQKNQVIIPDDKGIVIYQSSDRRAVALVPVFLVISLILLLAVLFMGKFQQNT